MKTRATVKGLLAVTAATLTATGALLAQNQPGQEGQQPQLPQIQPQIQIEQPQFEQQQEQQKQQEEVQRILTPEEARAGAARPSAEEIIAKWKQGPQETARKLIQKYGQPQEMTDNRLIWHDNGPWKRTEIVNEEIPHSFPKPHKDYLKQVINYKVPPEKFDELAQFDGSVIVDRTKGELAARCHMEDANFLALNLAAEIASGKKNVEEARQAFSDAIAERKNLEYMRGFVFQKPQGDTADPGEALQPR